jgi:hypothetical protein
MKIYYNGAQLAVHVIYLALESISSSFWVYEVVLVR